MNCNLNIELEKKYKTNKAFRKQMVVSSKKFEQFEQQAYYSELQASSKSMIVSVLADSPLANQLAKYQQIDYYIFIGAKQPNGAKSIEKIILNIIHIIPRPKKPYTIIYINTLAAKENYDDFKKATEFLPIEYFLLLDNIFVLHASFMSKATSWISFNIITTFVKEKTVYVNDFRELVDKASLKADQLIKLLPTPVQKDLAKREEYVDEILINFAPKLLTLAGFFPPSMNANSAPTQNLTREMKQEKKQEKKIQKEIDYLTSNVAKSSFVFLSSKKASKRYIQDYQIGQTGAPLPLQMLIYYFKQRENLLFTEGIFRKSVSIDDQNELLAEIDDQNYDFISTVSDPHLIANGIKRFLSYLILPIVPYPQYMKMMQCPPQRLTDTTIEVIRSLQQLRKKTMLVLLQFLMEKVIPKESQNKMNVKNISIVIGPCLMHSEVSSIKDLVYSQKIIAVTLIIFKEFDNIFGNKKERILALRRSAKRYSRAVLQDRLGRYEQNINQNNFGPAELSPTQKVIIEKSNEQVQEKINQIQQPKTPKFKLIHKMTFSLKEGMNQFHQKVEDDEFFEIEGEEETQKQLMKKIQYAIEDLSTAKITEQDFIDI